MNLFLYFLSSVLQNVSYAYGHTNYRQLPTNNIFLLVVLTWKKLVLKFNESHMAKALNKLWVDMATGPDGSTVIIKGN